MGFLAVLFLTLLSVSCSDKTGTEPAEIPAITQHQIAPGISLNQLKTVYPQATPDSHGQVRIKDTIAGLDGEWTFSFSGSVLSWATFDALYTDINENTFYLCRNATMEIIDSNTAEIGTPPRIEKGIQVFKDPSLQPHWGYSVIRAEWKDAGISKIIQFVFQGGKGERFSFRVSIELRS